MSTAWIDDDGGGVSSIAFQASATSTGSTITCPTVQQGDVGVLFDYANDATVIPSQVVPSGFTSLASSGTVRFRGTASYKVFDGTESGSTLTGQNGSSANSKVLLVFRPDGAIDTLTASTWLTEHTISDPSSQVIAASGQLAPLIRLAVAARNTALPSFSSGTFDATVTAGDLRAGYAVQNTSPASDTVDIGDDGTNWLASGWLRFS